MQELVTIKEGQPLTSTLLIAEGTQNEHASVIKLVRDYVADLEEFGPCRFEIDVVNRSQGGGKPTEYVLLNEEQATLLITYMRNSEIVRIFKKRLVKEFYEVKRGLAGVPQTTGQALVQMAQAFAEIEARQLALEKGVKAIEAKQSVLEQHTRDFSAMAFLRLKEHPATLEDSQRLSQIAKRISQDRGYPIGKVRDVRFGHVNTYIEDVLEDAYQEFLAAHEL